MLISGEWCSFIGKEGEREKEREREEGRENEREWEFVIMTTAS